MAGQGVEPLAMQLSVCNEASIATLIYRRVGHTSVLAEVPEGASPAASTRMLPGHAQARGSPCSCRSRLPIGSETSACARICALARRLGITLTFVDSAVT